MKIKTIKKSIFLLLMASSIMFTGCDNEEAEIIMPNPNRVEAFVDIVNEDPVVIDEVKLGDSWRLVREEGAYNDGSIRKEFDSGLNHPWFDEFKQHWIFSRNQVLINVEDVLHQTDKGDYYELFDYTLDEENKIIRIHYVYDGGDKKYTLNWKITSLTETELILTDRREEEDYFYQYTFIREKI